MWQNPSRDRNHDTYPEQPDLISVITGQNASDPTGLSLKQSYGVHRRNALPCPREFYGLVKGASYTELLALSTNPHSSCLMTALDASRIMVNHRESYSTYPCNGINLNHQSLRRGETF